MPKGQNRPSKSPGRLYEQIVGEIHKQYADSAEISNNVMIEGNSGEKRQIDVAIRTKVAGSYPILIIVECKDHKRPINIQKVEELIGKVSDVNADRGVLVSNSGFTKGAINRVKEEKNLQLVSVFDINNPNVRAIVTLPVQATIIELSPEINISFDITRHQEHPLLNQGLSKEEQQKAFNNEQKDLILKYIDSFEKEFIGWYRKNAVNLTSGEHSFTKTLIETNELTYKGKYTFMVAVSVYINENIFAKGAGIYDHISEKILTSGNKPVIKLGIELIKKTWTKKPDGYVLDPCNVFYRLVEQLSSNDFTKLKELVYKN